LSAREAAIVSACEEIENLAIRERLGFRLVWLASSASLRLTAGRTIHELPPSGPDAAVHQATIIRLPLSVAAALAPTLERLREQGSQHHYYPADTMHVTVLSMDQFLPDDLDAAVRLAELRAVISSYPSFDLAVHGLNVSPTTVFAQVIPQDRTLHSLRRNLRTIAKRSGSQAGREGVFGPIARNLVHANVVRFSGVVTEGFLDEISRRRRRQFGRWTVREVEFVQSDRLLSREGTQVVERIPLAV
jgi:2'-5' RNA ligase